MAISRRLRFEVFRRDGHACVYCGRRPPLVVLEADHRIPRCNGGKDTLDNLVAACWDCNRGKGPLPFKGREPEYWEHHYASWQQMMEQYFEFGGNCYLIDELPWWLGRKRERSPVVLNFDVYSAAAEIPVAEHVTIMTAQAIFRKADLF